MTTDAASAGRSNNPLLPPLLQQAVAAHQAGQLDAAYPLYRRFLDSSPGHPTALQLLGLLHSQRGEYESAVALMRESLRLFPQQAEVANNLGNALSRSGRLDEAIDSYAQALRLNPRYADALRNLGLCFLQKDDLEDAGKCFQRCIEVQPDDATAWLCIGNVYKRGNNFKAAIPCYEKAIELRRDYAEAHHNLGVCLRMRARPREALDHYRTARRLGVDRAELYQNLGSALVDVGDIGGAMDAYRAAVERNPEDLMSHRNLNSLLWQQDRLEDYLKSYRDALDKQPTAVELRLAYAMALNQQEAFEEAERVLMQGLRHSPQSAELKGLLGYTLEGLGQWTDALQVHAAAVAMPRSVPNHRVSYARALLACRRPDEALEQVKLAAVHMPLNQRVLAYLGLCWRMLGDERDEILNDYKKHVKVYDVPVPRQFSNAAEFNARLAVVLQSLHFGKRHPPEQTLRGGTQTTGDLFVRPEPEIADLVTGLKQCIQRYIGQMPRDHEHPLFSRRSRHFDFAASWSVRLARCGYHTMHIHPFGWISSAYYVEVPPEIVASDAQGGGLKFGEPDIDIGERGAARRAIQPAIGRLVLFPSYMWHGTVPFETGESRMTVAFDVVPTK